MRSVLAESIYGAMCPKRKTLRRVGSLTIALWAWLDAAHVGAAPAEKLRFDWVRVGAEAQKQCPGSESLERQIQQRLRTTPSARVEGTIRRDTSWVAQVVVQQRRKPSAERMLTSGDETCVEFSEAVALSIAILLDPFAQRQPIVAEATSAASIAPPERANAAATFMSISVGASAQVGTLPSVGIGPTLAVRLRVAPRWTINFGGAFLPEVTAPPFSFSLASGFLG
ncbi:MAG: hypothetical protein AAFV29_16100, partial [Myxococcota bacterium]